MNRNEFARDVEAAGKHLNTLRNTANDLGYPFSAGLIRGAEESLVVVYSSSTDCMMWRR